MWPMPYGIEHSMVPQRRWRQPITKTQCFYLQILREPIPCRGKWENQDDNKNKTNKNNKNYKSFFFFNAYHFLWRLFAVARLQIRSVRNTQNLLNLFLSCLTVRWLQRNYCSFVGRVVSCGLTGTHWDTSHVAFAFLYRHGRIYESARGVLVGCTRDSPFPNTNVCYNVFQYKLLKRSSELCTSEYT